MIAIYRIPTIILNAEIAVARFLEVKTLLVYLPNNTHRAEPNHIIASTNGTMRYLLKNVPGRKTSGVATAKSHIVFLNVSIFVRESNPYKSKLLKTQTTAKYTPICDSEYIISTKTILLNTTLALKVMAPTTA